VLVYGGSPEYEPARVVWALRYYRHGDVRYLDGGFAAWVDAGGRVEPGEPPPGAPTDYAVTGLDPGVVVSGAWLRDRLGDAPYSAVPIQIVDARSAGEFDAGHIPSALHVDWTRNLQRGRLISGAALGAVATYPGLDPRVTTVAYCLVGWRASVTWLTLTELGFEDVRVYDASWAEWGQGGFPVE
jgi:thiosulfate/3-mercaptopyruvate sulfurtransferase